ncbi:MAG: hypothetical protein HY824_13430 [Acidobacteria bacterium]|nr:hypothetical protein [Acidobacteriota bacterium]
MRTRTVQSGIRWSLVCAALLAAWTGAAAWAQAVGDQSAAARVFAERIERYETLRARLEEPLPPFVEPRRTPWSVMLTRRYLASAIRTARSRAQVGDFFAPPVADLFRQALAAAIHERLLEGLAGDEPGLSVDLAVNEPVPAWALNDLPGSLLARLPALPPGLDYRTVNGALILWDLHAEILVDALPDALCDVHAYAEEGR